MEHVEKAKEVIYKRLAQDKGQDRLFMLNNASWTLYLSGVLYNVQQLFPSGCPHITKLYLLAGILKK